ncbi:MAG: MarR family transcriptional regulator [Rhizomicrobium sp.]
MTDKHCCPRRSLARLHRQSEAAHAGTIPCWRNELVAAFDAEPVRRDGPATVTAIARAEGLRPQSMGATIREFEASGYVTGAADPDDGRQTLWSVTPLARDLVQDGAGRAAGLAPSHAPEKFLAAGTR